MLKSISKLGTVLNKTQQRSIAGGGCGPHSRVACGGGCVSCSKNSDCPSGVCATNRPQCAAGARTCL
jgi:hypothetical protein